MDQSRRGCLFSSHSLFSPPIMYIITAMSSVERKIHQSIIQVASKKKECMQIPKFFWFNSNNNRSAVRDIASILVILTLALTSHLSSTPTVPQTALHATPGAQRLGGTDVYAERWAPFVKELAVMVARSPDGTVLPSGRAKRCRLRWYRCLKPPPDKNTIHSQNYLSQKNLHFNSS